MIKELDIGRNIVTWRVEFTVFYLSGLLAPRGLISYSKFDLEMFSNSSLGSRYYYPPRNKGHLPTFRPKVA